MCASLVRGFAQACASWLSAYFMQYPYNVFPLYTFIMAGSAVLLGGWLDQYAEVMLTDLELATELYFDFRSDGNPAKLMPSLYHAQQGSRSLLNW